FFFSSRRRHTRWPRDWSSDVCSSDLPSGFQPKWQTILARPALKSPSIVCHLGWKPDGYCCAPSPEATSSIVEPAFGRGLSGASKIGRASCRERGVISGEGGVFTNNVE